MFLTNAGLTGANPVIVSAPTLPSATLAFLLSTTSSTSKLDGILLSSQGRTGAVGVAGLTVVGAVDCVPLLLEGVAKDFLEVSELFRLWAGRGIWALEAAYRWSSWPGGWEVAFTILTIRSAMFISILSLMRYMRG